MYFATRNDENFISHSTFGLAKYQFSNAACSKIQRLRKALQHNIPYIFPFSTEWKINLFWGIKWTSNVYVHLFMPPEAIQSVIRKNREHYYLFYSPEITSVIILFSIVKWQLLSINRLLSSVKRNSITS
jgi:hypothetical protein